MRCCGTAASLMPVGYGRKRRDINDLIINEKPCAAKIATLALKQFYVGADNAKCARTMGMNGAQ